MRAISEVDITIAQKEFITFLGPSGCGKTTTLRLLAGFLAPDSGRITVAGEILSSPDRVVPPEQRRMGMVFQNYAVWPHMSVMENIAFGLRYTDFDRREHKARIERVVAAVGLEGLEDRHPAQLSGGQQQRVALARSLVVEPSILLLDEPLSNLDAKLRERMRFELKALQRRTGITFIYVTHDQSEAMVLSDRIAVFHSGKVQQVGTPREIYERPANLFVADFMGLVNKVARTRARPQRQNRGHRSRGKPNRRDRRRTRRRYGNRGDSAGSVLLCHRVRVRGRREPAQRNGHGSDLPRQHHRLHGRRRRRAFRCGCRGSGARPAKWAARRC